MKPPFPAYDGDDPYVFVCYSHEDSAAVYEDISLLRSKGLCIWYDEGISPGSEWSEELAHALEKADQLLFYVSDSSANSRHCRDEVNFAHNHDKPVVAVYLSEVELPVGLELSIGSIQAIHKFNLSTEQYLAKMGAVLGISVKTESGTETLAMGPDPARASRSTRRRTPYFLAAAIIVAVAVFAQLNRNYLLAAAAIYWPLIFSDAIEQQIGFAVSRDDVRIAYATTGKGSPIVMVLGWATHLQKGVGSPTYDNLGLLAMSSENHLFVRYDGRGAGLSDRNVEDFSLRARVADIEAVVDALALDQFTIYALSAGGPAGISYTRKHPEKVVSLVLASTQASSNYLTDAERIEFGRMFSLFETSWETPSVTNLMVNRIFPEADEVTRRIVGEFFRISGQGPDIYRFFTQQYLIDVEDEAKEIVTPTLVIHARDDPIIPLEAGRTLASLIRGAKFEIVEGAHGSGTGGTPETRRIILDFIESVPARAM
jgi:pimeloyl-ACP methyl ester carboxylesterase